VHFGVPKCATPRCYRMATPQHMYRRSAVYWWRRVLDLSPSVRFDMRISLRAAAKTEARDRAGYPKLPDSSAPHLRLASVSMRCSQADSRYGWCQFRLRINRDSAQALRFGRHGFGAVELGIRNALLH
jgi:hypothetical protein